MTITKAKLTTNLSKSLGINLKEAGEIVELFFEEICLALEKGEPVKLSGFGNFSARDKKARLGRNPKTGKSALITARRVVTFRAGQKLKLRMTRLKVKGQESHG